MWLCASCRTTRYDGFFNVAVRYDTLENHYHTVFLLMHEHKWNWGDIQNMLPYERDIYVILLKQWLDRQTEELKRRQQKA